MFNQEPKEEVKGTLEDHNNSSWTSPTAEENQYTYNLRRWMNDLGWKLSFELS